MIKNIINSYKNLDSLAYKIMKNGLKFCFLLSILAALILLVYKDLFASPYMYYIGINLFRLSIVFSSEFIICAFVVDSLKKQLI